MWDLIVSVPDHCLSFYFAAVDSDQHICPVVNALRPPSDFLKEAAV